MTQSPYLGQSVGRTGPPSSDFGPTSEFGATTVSGSPVARDPGSTSGPRHDAGRAGASQSGVTTTVPAVDLPGTQTTSGRPSDPPKPAPAPAPGPAVSGRGRGPRRARLQLRHIDPWTVLKFSCVLAIALFFVWLIVVGVLYGVLEAAGAVDKVNDTVTTINGEGSEAPITAGVVFGGAAIIGVVNIALFIALSTIGAVVYNLCADLVGGIELTLSER